MFDSLKVVVYKELKRVFTDKRLVFTTLLLPPIMLVLLYWIMGVGIESFTSDIEEHKSIVYVVNAPNEFGTILDSLDMKINTLHKGDNLKRVKEEILQGDADLLIAFPENFAQQVKDYRTNKKLPSVDTYYNDVEEYSSTAYFDMTEVFSKYEEELLGQRFGNINYANVFELDVDNKDHIITDDKKANGKIISMILPMLLTIFLFAGSMGIGADTIAGDKERGTMATLLLTPVKREIIIFGKIISLAIVAFSSAFTSFLGIVISLPLMLKSTGEMSIGVGNLINYGIVDYLLIFLVLLALEGVFVGLISMTSVLANSVKEANSYMMPIYILVVIASFSNMYSTGEASIVEYALPIYGSVMALKDIFSFNINLTGLLINVGVSIGFSCILIFMIKKLFDSEKVMFSS